MKNEKKKKKKQCHITTKHDNCIDHKLIIVVITVGAIIMNH